MSNPFVLHSDAYKRELNPTEQYLHQATNYLHVMTGKSHEECRAFIVNSVKEKQFPNIRDPQVEFLERQENGDRIKTTAPLSEYLNQSIGEADVIAPTLTCYHNAKVKPSIPVDFIDSNVKARGVAKRAEFAAEARGDKVAAKLSNIEQTNRKLSNNAFSGAMVSASTPLYNKTGHSSLTSICRCTSGYGNANNEKIMTGNRHYWSADVVMNNIASIISNTDYNELSVVVDKYAIHIPTVEQTLQCIKYSTDLYWKDDKAFERIAAFLSRLNGMQRAAFVYTGDLYHLRIHNESLVRDFMQRLSMRVTSQETVPDPIVFIHSKNEDYVNLAHLICIRETEGIGKDYKQVSAENINTLAHTVNNIDKTVNDYADLIKVFLVTSNVPASLAYFPTSIRRAALTSDTDSTIFTVEEWVRWYKHLTPKSNIVMDEVSIAVAATCIFIASQAITHILARMSANIGVEQKRLHQVAMKNEFFFPVFIPTQLNKHYFAKILCQEGNVFSKMKNEIKGVHLKSSNVPKNITAFAEDLMNSIMDAAMKGENISLVNTLKSIAVFENTIMQSLLSGETTYYKLMQIKSSEAYKSTNGSSPYNHHVFWQTVFAPSYAPAPNPTYSCIKIPTIVSNKTALLKWADSIADIDIKPRLISYMSKNKKDSYPTIYLSQENIGMHGIPKEIQGIIDCRRIILDLCNSIYIVLETLGFYKKPDELILDHIPA